MQHILGNNSKIAQEQKSVEFLYGLYHSHPSYPSYCLHSGSWSRAYDALSKHSIMWVINTVENLDLFCLKMAYQTYLVKIVFIVQNKSSQYDIAHNYVHRSHAEHWTRTNQGVQTNR